MYRSNRTIIEKSKENHVVNVLFEIYHNLDYVRFDDKGFSILDLIVTTIHYSKNSKISAFYWKGLYYQQDFS
jgi:hypothetical protein